MNALHIQGATDSEVSLLSTVNSNKTWHLHVQDASTTVFWHQFSSRAAENASTTESQESKQLCNPRNRYQVVAWTKT